MNAFREAGPEDDSVGAVIKVIGVGGRGCFSVNSMAENELLGVELIAANTDRKDLTGAKVKTTLQLGPTLAKGKGVGMKPDLGAKAAEESLEEIKELLRGSDMLFIAAGLGGGTGTGAAPVIARVSQEMGILTVAVVGMPFSFEGKLKSRLAEEGWKELRQYTDAIITLPNDRCLSQKGKESIRAATGAMGKDVLMQAVKAITDMVNLPGEHSGLDFNDVSSTMKGMGKAVIGVGRASGENRVMEAAQKAIDNPLMDDSRIDGAKGLLLHLRCSSEIITYDDFVAAAGMITKQCSEEAITKFGISNDESLGEDVIVSVVATGVGEQTNVAVGSGHGKTIRGPGPVIEPIIFIAKPRQPPPGSGNLPGSDFGDERSPLSGSLKDRSGGISIDHGDDVQMPNFIRKIAN
ncbi:MAG: cell division protein FtsZ [Desulfobulbaceae bacterium]|jgi:cell division protein FtsZ|nr:cell division protein FtsZ [Desulfobulbaceae bacterium]